MFNYRGENNVKSGFYLNLAKWEIVTVARGGGILPGSSAHRYVKLPILLVLILAPILGLLYVIFLPFIGFAMVLALVGRKALGALRHTITQVGRSLRARQQA